MLCFCLIPWFSSNILLSKTSQMANPQPNILDLYSFMWRERIGDEHCDDPGSLVTIFSLLLTGWPRPHRTLSIGGNWSMKAWVHKDTYGWMLGVRVYFIWQEMFKCDGCLSNEKALTLALFMVVVTLGVSVKKLLTSLENRVCQSV